MIEAAIRGVGSWEKLQTCGATPKMPSFLFLWDLSTHIYTNKVNYMFYCTGTFSQPNLPSIMKEQQK